MTVLIFYTYICMEIKKGVETTPDFKIENSKRLVDLLKFLCIRTSKIGFSFQSVIGSKLSFNTSLLNK